ALTAGEGGGDVEPALLVEGHALWAAEAAVEGLHLAGVRDAEHRVEAGCSGPGDGVIIVWTEGEVVGRDGWVQGGEDEDLTVGADLENSAGAIAHIEIVFGIEGNSGSHAHAFHVHAHVAGGRDLVDEAIVAAGDVQHALFVEGEGGGESTPGRPHRERAWLPERNTDPNIALESPGQLQFSRLLTQVLIRRRRSLCADSGRNANGFRPIPER